MNNRQQASAGRDRRRPTPYGKILVATDGSDCSMLAAAHAIYLAESLGARLYAVYAVDAPRAFHIGIHFREAMTELEASGAKAVAAVREMAEERGLECEEIVAEGSPHESIILTSERVDADLVILGSTGMTGLERALLGSVSRRVLLYSGRPVLLVREP
ncbi:MAG TPA: universal stress protein [Rubrobacter sp.]|nr:universal stress protein [Rubrobacter sp.]